MSISKSGLCSIKFGAEWCAPCKTLDVNFKKIKEEFKDVQYYDVDIDEEPSLAKEYQIKSVPTIVLSNDGQEVNRIVGAVLMKPLRKAFRDFIGENDDE